MLLLADRNHTSSKNQGELANTQKLNKRSRIESPRTIKPQMSAFLSVGFILKIINAMKLEIMEAMGKMHTIR